MMTNKRLTRPDYDYSKVIKSNSSQIDWDKIRPDNNPFMFGNFFLQEASTYLSADKNILIGLSELSNIITSSYSLTSRKFNLWKKLALHLDFPIHEAISSIDNPAAQKLADGFKLSTVGIFPPNYYFRHQAWINGGSNYEQSLSCIVKLTINTDDYSTVYYRIRAFLDLWDRNIRFCIRNIKQDFINYSSDIERTIHNLEIIRLILQHLTSPYFLPRVSKNKQYDFSNNQAVEKFNLNSKFCELCWQPTIRSEEIKKFNQKNTNDQIPLMRSINLSNRYCKDHNPADNKSRYRKDLRYKSAFIHEVFASMTKAKLTQSNYPISLNPQDNCLNYMYGDEEERRKAAYILVHSRLLLKPAKFKIIPKNKLATHPNALTKTTLAAKVLELLQQGLSQSEIAKILGKSRQEISRANKKLTALEKKLNELDLIQTL
jgi:hypothetical protein